MRHQCAECEVTTDRARLSWLGHHWAGPPSRKACWMAFITCGACDSGEEVSYGTPRRAPSSNSDPPTESLPCPRKQPQRGKRCQTCREWTTNPKAAARGVSRSGLSVSPLLPSFAGQGAFLVQNGRSGQWCGVCGGSPPRGRADETPTNSCAAVADCSPPRQYRAKRPCLGIQTQAEPFAPSGLAQSPMVQKRRRTECLVDSRQ